jgi:hypothetical protein
VSQGIEDIHELCISTNIGAHLGKRGRRPDPKTVAAITEMKERPETVAKVRSLMGLATVVREYIPAMSTVKKM